MAKDLVNTLADLKEKEALKIVEDRLSAGEDPLKILDDAKTCRGNRGQAVFRLRVFHP